MKWRRQHPLGKYILDFYCPELKLALELDGMQHEERVIHDRDGVRDLELRKYGVETIRIPNSLLIRDSLLVEQIVVAAVAQRRAVMRT